MSTEKLTLLIDIIIWLIDDTLGDSLFTQLSGCILSRHWVFVVSFNLKPFLLWPIKTFLAVVENSSAIRIYYQARVDYCLLWVLLITYLNILIHSVFEPFNNTMRSISKNNVNKKEIDTGLVYYFFMYIYKDYLILLM